MEMVETQNQNPTIMGIRYNNPRLFESCEVREELWLSRKAECFATFAATLNALAQLTRNRLLALLSTQFFAASSPAFSASS